MCSVCNVNEKLSLVKSPLSHNNNSTLFGHFSVYKSTIHEYVRPGAFYYPEVAREIV